MNKLIIIILLYLMGSDATAQQSFDFLFHSDEDKLLVNGAVDLDGNTVIVGRIGEYFTGINDGLIMKVLPDGSYTTRRFELTDFNSALYAAVVLDNGNYMVLGAFGEADHRYYRDNFWVMILDQELEVLVEKSYLIDDFYTGVGTSMKAQIDDEENIVVVGTVIEKVNNVQYFTDYVMYKLNQEGDTLLSRYYQYPYSQAPYELMKIPESDEWLLLGARITTNAIPSLVIMDNDLQINETHMIFSIPTTGNLNAAKWLNETDFLVAVTLSFQNNKFIDNYIGVFRMNSSAEVFEELVLSIADTSIYNAWDNSIVEANDSTIYVAGFQAFASTTTPNAVYLFLIDSQMNLLGTNGFFKGDAQYQVQGALPMPDGGCLMYINKHRINDQGILERDIFIRKYLREDFEIITKVEELPEALPRARAWPNPARDELHISLEAFGQGQQLRFRLYDAQGQKYVDKQIGVTGNSLQARISVLAPGMYVYELEGPDGQKQGGKFVKE